MINLLVIQIVKYGRENTKNVDDNGEEKKKKLSS